MPTQWSAHTNQCEVQHCSCSPPRHYTSAFGAGLGTPHTETTCGNIPSWAEIQVCQRQCAQRMSREDAKPSSSKPLVSCPEEARRSRGGRWAEHGCTSPASGEGRSRAVPTARLTAAVRTGCRTAMLQSSLKLSNAGPKVLSVMINNSKKSSLHIGI